MTISAVWKSVQVQETSETFPAVVMTGADILEQNCFDTTNIALSTLVLLFENIQQL